MILLIALFTKHFIFDFMFQPPYMYLNKGTWTHPGGYLHAAIHAVATYTILVFSGIGFPLVALLSVGEFCIHYLMDFIKVNVCKTKGYTPTTHEEWFWWLGFDQLIHSLTYISIYGVINASTI